MENNYYVYVYLDLLKPGIFNYQNINFDFEPFYIGKGKNSRNTNHLTNCFNKTNKLAYRRIFYKKLRKMLDLNNKPNIIIYKNNLTEIEAFNLEIELITKIGRRPYKEGPLCNNSTGGEGTSGSKSPRKTYYVYNNDGYLVDAIKGLFNCAEKYKTCRNSIYKCAYNIRNYPLKGFRFSLEKKKRIEPFIRGKNTITEKERKTDSRIYRLIELFDKEGNKLAEYNYMKEACEATGISRSAIENNICNLSKFCKHKEFNRVKFKYKQ